jgi:hypothetical protein
MADNGPLDLRRPVAAAATGGSGVLVWVVVVEGLHDHRGVLQEPVQPVVLACVCVGGKERGGVVVL